MLNKLNTGDSIKVYSAGILEGQGNYVSTFHDSNSSFLTWKNDYGNEVYTNINSISVEIIKKSSDYNTVSDHGYKSNYPKNNNYSSNTHHSPEFNYFEGYIVNTKY
ncbi:hypothetical protein [Bacillus thuringiensis]|uniref:hypothetical protein n=1 Tax=Bacillus thuringiensis TaxID=1428 RepID=UPI001EDE2A29|nr:hypothetical protein [Bacillus thuringiensis]MCG3426195.1 hypothetical protein [Bacillus thuringiensis]